MRTEKPLKYSAPSAYYLFVQNKASGHEFTNTSETQNYNAVLEKRTPNVFTLNSKWLNHTPEEPNLKGFKQFTE